MVQEIFIVEDKEKLINELTEELKGNKDISLRHIPSRRVARAFA